MGTVARLRTRGAASMLAICAALVISRWVFFPRYLITFDEVNFALAIEHFNPSLHQPQPPGYPVFVALLKLLALAVPKIETVFLIAGLIVGAAALALVRSLGEQLGGRRVGLIAAALLLFNPAFWLSALTNPVRLCFAAGALAVALCGWLACVRKSPGWLIAAAAALGLAAGARPSLALLMAPLLLWTACRLRIRPRTVAAATLACLSAVATWLPVTVLAAGGAREFWRMIGGYSQAQMGGSSLLFGASWTSALHMAWEAIAWTCLGALSWLWELPSAWRRLGAALHPLAASFLALWFFPGLLFYSVFHVGDPDHTLSIVPATCLAGALVLNAATRDASAGKCAAMLSVAVLLNVFLFFKPITKTTKPSTYAPVRWAEAYTTGILEGVRDLRANGPVTVVFGEGVTGWRNLMYYEPSVSILVIMDRHSSALTIWRIHRRRVTEEKLASGPVTLPARGILAWVDLTSGPRASGGAKLPTVRPRVYFAPAREGESFDYSGIRFVTADAR